ncbi:MAG TPA: hypothetical protein VMG41_17500 [Gemmatimonadales bacterium]|nr:hypothetical protein [Gemmatimonadales bacterium]
MTLHPLVGHEAQREKVLRALREDRLPQVILITGPRGVGKQRFALWAGEALLCETLEARPCGSCRACRQVRGLGHPDLHWVMPVPRPKASDPEKQLEELAETIGAVVEERRRQPLFLGGDGLAGHFVATARLLQRRASLTPAAGTRKVFIVAEAERLVPQESSPEAANALLKLLEEPPADTHFLLTTVDPGRLLPTIRSRAVPLRLGRLPDAVVEQFLATYAGLAGEELRRRVEMARGAIGLGVMPDDAQARPVQAAAEFLAAVRRGSGSRMERAFKQGTWAARSDFSAMLDAVAEALADAVRGASGGTPRRPVPEALRDCADLAALVTAEYRVAAAREAAQGNVNPQLLLATLGEDLAEVL